jgi:carbamate kinase
MGPKIEAAIDFLSRRRGRVLITDPPNLLEGLEGRAGTMIT